MHAISKEGYSYKFSEAIVEIPEVTNDDVYVHAICESSIGIFDVELDFALCNDNDPDKDQELFPALEKYSKMISKINFDEEKNVNPEYLSKANNLIQDIIKINPMEFTEEALEKLNVIKESVIYKYNKVHARYNLMINTCLALVEKNPLYITQDGTIKVGYLFHNSDEVRYPLISVIICKSIKEFFSADLNLSPNAIDSYLMEVVTFFASLTSAVDIKEVGNFCLLSSASFIATYAIRNYPNRLTSFIPSLVLTCKHSLSVLLDHYSDEILNLDMANFSEFAANRKFQMIDFLVPPKIIENVMSFLTQRIDYELAMRWIESPFEFEIQNFQKKIPDAKFPMMKAIEFIKANSTAIIKKKVNFDKLEKRLQGSFAKRVFDTLVRTKQISLSQKKIDSFFDGVRENMRISSATDFVEVYCTPDFSSNLPEVMPEPNWNSR